MLSEQSEDTGCPCMPMPRAMAIVPAAGQGARMGGTTNKPFLDLDGVPVLIRTLRSLSACPCVQGLVIVAKPDEIEAINELLERWPTKQAIMVIPGGSTRQESVRLGLMAATQAAPALFGDESADPVVAIHDGARCLVSRAVICRTICHAAAVSPCAAALPVKDTIKQADSSGQVKKTLDRSELFAVQTPQTARLSIFSDAYEQARISGFCATDDLSVLEAAGCPVMLVAGDERNIKLTTPFDLKLARTLLADMV